MTTWLLLCLSMHLQHFESHNKFCQKDWSLKINNEKLYKTCSYIEIVFKFVFPSKTLVRIYLRISRMNKSCCFVLQYNTEALVLVFQYYFGNWGISNSRQSVCSKRVDCSCSCRHFRQEWQKKLKESFKLKLK
jgi:hypothetical protein